MPRLEQGFPVVATTIARPDPGGREALALHEHRVPLREEIEALRAQLAEREDERTAARADLDAPIPPVSPAAGTETTVRALDRDDSIALAARVTALEAELAERDAEHARLDTALAETRARDTQRREKIDLLEDRLAAQDDALDAARREYELERRRHTRSRGIINRLRTTLSAAAPDESLSEDAGPIAEPERPTLRDEASSVAESGDDATSARHEVELRIGHAPPAKESALPEHSLDARRAEARLFDAWLDDQGRTHQGKKVYRGPLAGGKQAEIPLGVTVPDTADLNRRVRVEVTAARIAQ